MLFKKQPKINKTPELTRELATKIYNLFLAGKDETRMFIEDGINTKLSYKVLQECKKLESQVYSKISKDMTKTALKKLIVSEMLDTSIVIDDVIRWSDGNPDAAPTYNDFRVKYTKVM